MTQLQEQYDDQDVETRLVTHKARKIDMHLYKERLISHPEYDECMMFVEELEDCSIGRYLLSTQGFNGYWFDYLCQPVPKIQRPIADIEKFIVQEAPLSLAFKESRSILQKIVSQNIQDYIRMASLPCGLMTTFFELDFSHVSHFSLLGLDLDCEAINISIEVAKKRNLLNHVQYIHGDVFDFLNKDDFHLIIGFCMEFYITSRDYISNYFQVVHNALKKNGAFVGAFFSDSSYWNIKDEDLLAKQVMIFDTILSLPFGMRFTLDDMAEILEKIGFYNIQFVFDEQKMVPVVFCQKK
jgi:hypothetical protein